MIDREAIDRYAAFAGVSTAKAHEVMTRRAARLARKHREHMDMIRRSTSALPGPVTTDA